MNLRNPKDEIPRLCPNPETVRKDARAKLLAFLFKLTGDRKLALECASIIHGPLCMYEMSTRTTIASVEKLKGVVIRKLHHRVSGGAIESLERLKRTVDSKWYFWAKAWAERTPTARKAIVAACAGQPIPGFGRIPEPGEVVPLLPAASAYAKMHALKATTTKTERNCAVVAVLIAYRKAFGKPTLSKSPQNPTIRFIEGVENCYRDLLPQRFGITGSSTMLSKLIAQSLRY